MGPEKGRAVRHEQEAHPRRSVRPARTRYGPDRAVHCSHGDIYLEMESGVSRFHLHTYITLHTLHKCVHVLWEGRRPPCPPPH